MRDEVSTGKMDLSKYNDFYSRVLQYACNLSKNSVATDLTDKKMSIFKDERTGRTYYVDYASVRSGKWIVVHICSEVDFFSVAAISIIGNVAMIWVVVAIGIFGMFISSRFVGRVNACRNVAEKISSGVFEDLGTVKNADDETGRLARAMSRAIRRMSSIFENVKVVHTELAENVKQINTALENYAFQSNLIDVQTGKITASVKQISESRRNVGEAIDKVDVAIAKSVDFTENVRKDIVNIDIPDDVSANVCIASVHGQTVYERKNMTGHNTVDMTGLTKGMYVVAIRNGNELVSIKIIKIGN